MATARNLSLILKQTNYTFIKHNINKLSFSRCYHKCGDCGRIYGLPFTTRIYSEAKNGKISRMFLPGFLFYSL